MPPRINAVFASIGLAVLTLCATAGAAPLPDRPDAAGDPLAAAPPVVAELRALLADPADEEAVQGADLDRGMLADFYAERDYRPLWTGKDGAHPAARALAERLARAERHGLDPSDYSADAIARRLDASQPDRLAALELLLSQALARYAVDLRQGRLGSGIDYTAEELEPRERRPVGELRRAASAESLKAFLVELHRFNPIYEGLVEALARYREEAGSRVKVQIPDGPVLEEGERDPRVLDLRRRLDLPIPEEDAELYDQAVARAVERYQEASGLAVDGILGPNTLASLNATVAERIRTALVNLERARWLPRDLGRRFVLVDTAAFRVSLFDENEEVESMRAIVGKEYQRTPMFADRIEHMIVNPYWNVPRSIVRDEIAPKMIADPGYLARQDMEILSGWGAGAGRLDPARINWHSVAAGDFGFRIRQRSGPENALGRIKFMFPNKYSIYLHDTPARELFEKTRRTFSHGCIRVEKPIRLADFLLAETPAWDAARVEEAIGSGRRQRIEPARPVPVYITYFTAWPAPDGTLEFRPDVYDRDSELKAQLFGSS